MGKTAFIRAARVEPGLKTEVEAILLHLGMTTPEAIHLPCLQIEFQRGLPFEVRIPDEFTARTLRAGKAGKAVKKFATQQEFYADLGL